MFYWIKSSWLVLLWLLISGCSPGSAVPDSKLLPADQTSPAVPKVEPKATADPGVKPIATFQFVDVAESVGLRFLHHSPFTKQRHVHLTMGSGLGWLDFDHDGTPDLFCCQGAAFGDAAKPNASGLARLPTDTLFQNRGGSFSDVTRPAGLVDWEYSMGVSAADFDNDGFMDLFVTGYGENRLFHNCGDGCFSRVSIPAAVSAGRLSASCAWGDIDNDGNLDLFVTNYAKLGPENYPLCSHTANGHTIAIACHPSHLEPVADLLYHNLGNGEFVEISREVGISDQPRQGLGVIAADLDQDGDTDFYVANDTTPNQLWENDGDGHFIDRGVSSGTATDRHGASEAGMGVAVGDVDGNGQLDLLTTNFYYESITLYRNDGQLLFVDVSDEIGLGAPSRLRLGFGISLADFDNDSWLDVFVANGHVHDLLHEIQRDEPFAQLPQLFQNKQGTMFLDVSSASGTYFQTPHVGRGAAVADFDRDGDWDIAVSHLNGNTALLRNDAPTRGNWLRLELIGIDSNRGGVGAVVQLELDGRTLVRSVGAGTSYLSCDEQTMLIGLGLCDQVGAVTISWPNGRRECWKSLVANRSYRFIEGTGQSP